jgi:hypothetical protein
MGFWLSQNAPAARKWIDESGLPEAYWVELLNPGRGAPPAPKETGVGDS